MRSDSLDSGLAVSSCSPSVEKLAYGPEENDTLLIDHRSDIVVQADHFAVGDNLNVTRFSHIDRVPSGVSDRNALEMGTGKIRGSTVWGVDANNTVRTSALKKSDVTLTPVLEN